jgi:hypothetical protein
VLAVPNAAIRRDEGGTHVLVSTADGAVRRAIRTGVRGRTHTEVVEGLEEGEAVVIEESE